MSNFARLMEHFGEAPDMAVWVTASDDDKETVECFLSTDMLRKVDMVNGWPQLLERLTTLANRAKRDFEREGTSGTNGNGHERS